MSEASIIDQDQEAGFGDFVALLKPRVMSLVVFTAFVGLVVAPGGVHPVIGFASVLFIAIGAGASGALNMWYDADIDAVMRRTASRPVPSGKVEAQDALAIGVTLSAMAVVMLGLAANLVAAGLLAFTIFFYAVVYTMLLKRWTPHNIVIGGAAGAFPPMIGWAVVTGGVSLESSLMFALIFMWTPPHFWALALWRAGDYAKVGVPMLPVVAGAAETRKQILIYSVILALVALAPVAVGLSGALYGFGAALLGGFFIRGALTLWREKSDHAARRLFAFSILYLFLIFALLVADRLAEPWVLRLAAACGF